MLTQKLFAIYTSDYKNRLPQNTTKTPWRLQSAGRSGKHRNYSRYCKKLKKNNVLRKTESKRLQELANSANWRQTNGFWQKPQNVLHKSLPAPIMTASTEKTLNENVTNVLRPIVKSSIMKMDPFKKTLNQSDADELSVVRERLALSAKRSKRRHSAIELSMWTVASRLHRTEESGEKNARAKIECNWKRLTPRGTYFAKAIWPLLVFMMEVVLKGRRITVNDSRYSVLAVKVSSHVCEEHWYRVE